MRDENHDTRDWYNEEALPLGDLFSIQEIDNANFKTLLKDLNLNFGSNGKCYKKRGIEGGGSIGDHIQDDVVTHGV